LGQPARSVSPLDFQSSVIGFWPIPDRDRRKILRCLNLRSDLNRPLA
jgi:hypothetical protein